jgi:hypothetical protein
MKILGIPLRRPSLDEITAATVMGVGLWVAAVGLMKALRVDFTLADAGALLLVLVWACNSVRLGIRIEQGRRHLLANLAVSALLLGLYETARVVAS